MSKEIRELKSLLLQAGFTCRTGKGSHTNWYHPLLTGRVTISGKDAKEYQEKDVSNAIKRIEEIKKVQEEEEE